MSAIRPSDFSPIKENIRPISPVVSALTSALDAIRRTPSPVKEQTQPETELKKESQFVKIRSRITMHNATNQASVEEAVLQKSLELKTNGTFAIWRDEAQGMVITYLEMFLSVHTVEIEPGFWEKKSGQNLHKLLEDRYYQTHGQNVVRG